MDIVTGAISNLVPKLGELLKAEYDLQKGVRKQVESLQTELQSISAVLHKVAQQMPDQLDDQVKTWAHEVRTVSYDMEDILDTFLVRVEGREPATSDRFGRLLDKTKSRHKITSAIKDIKKQLQEVADRCGRYMVGDIMAKSNVMTVDPRLSTLYNDVTKLVGIDKASDELISMLSSQCDNGEFMNKVKKVCILGPGGWGKITLVKVVYEKLKTSFGCVAFVPVGRNPDIKKVLKDILIDLDHGFCWTEDKSPPRPFYIT